MDTSTIIIASIQIIASLAAIVFFLLGLYAAIKDIQYINPDDPDDEMAHSKAAFKKGMIFIACGIGVYFISRFCYNLPQMAPQNYGIAVILLQSLWDAVKNTGFLLLFPFIVRQWRKTARRNAYYK